MGLLVGAPRVAAFAAAVGVAAGVAGARRLDVPSLADVLPSVRLSTLPARPYTAWVVLQINDCDSRLDALRALRRPIVRPHVTVAIAVVGSQDDRRAVAARVAAREMDIPVYLANTRLPRAVRALGFRDTPVLVMLDAERRVHWAAPLPVTLDGIARWYAVIPSVVGA